MAETGKPRSSGRGAVTSKAREWVVRRPDPLYIIGIDGAQYRAFVDEETGGMRIELAFGLAGGVLDNLGPFEASEALLLAHWIGETFSEEARGEPEA